MKRFILFYLLIANMCFAISLKANYAVLMDFETGEVIYQKNGNEKTNPSSMTKIMTTYLIFKKLENKSLSIDDKFFVSENAWRQEGSRTFLAVHTKVSVDNLLRGLIVQSGNDAAITLAEGVNDNVDDFVKEMNNEALKMKLETTNFTNPIGFTSAQHYMSVYDLAVLSKNLIKDYPTLYKKYFPIKEFTWNKIKQPNRNVLLNYYKGVDGLKTGHTEAGGYGIVVSAERNGRRLISVINGATTQREREVESEELLDIGWKAIREIVYKGGETIKNFPLKYGKKDSVDVIAESDVVFWSVLGEKAEPNIIFYKELKAPVKQGERVGEILLGGRQYNLIVKEDVKEVNIFVKMYRKLFK
ncbi:MAG: D-alanyl-D-alanine carboxypeptidase family protein [Rickettsiales bacterium]|nr:MAG: D-alanyl-D-alanine carboxypeptidase family protein [Rickettsiales bacterium]